MNSKYIKQGIIAVVVAGIVSLLAYQFTSGIEYSYDMIALRDLFNRDKGKVRLLVLLSPT